MSVSKGMPGGVLPMRDESKWPWAPYDPAAPLEARVEYLEARINDLLFEEQFHDRFLECCSEMLYEMGSSVPMEFIGRDGRPHDRVKSLASYWRWVLWEDCMADVPTQVERVFQAVLAGLVWR